MPERMTRREPRTAATEGFWEDLADHEVVEEHAQRGEVLPATTTGAGDLRELAAGFPAT